MISFHGQHEHRRLTLSDFQLEALDSACGPRQAERRGAARSAHEAVLGAVTHLDRLSGGGSGGRRELDLLRWELDEIESTSPDPDELVALTEERDRLGSADRIRLALEGLLDSLSPEYGDHSVRDTIAASAKAFDSLPGGGAGLGGLPERLAALGVELDDLGAAAREQLDGLDSSPERLDEIERRLEALSHLERKYGGSIESVLAHADECRTRIAEMEDLDGAIERAEADLDSARDKLEAICGELSTARHEAAGPLAEAVEEALGDLALDGARFEIAIRRREHAGSTGSDRVDFMVAPNAGIGPAPLGETASGGEISRVLLALLSVAYSGDGGVGRLLVFDEIDAGIGGRTAVAVGSRLSQLAEGSQVLCITHLAPVAARADRHFTIEKRQGSGVAETVVEGLDGDRLITEMVRMLGASEGDQAARAHAVELLSGAGRPDAA
jgi:DNA repair protein RecN (Recombination protein N)